MDISRNVKAATSEFRNQSKWRERESDSQRSFLQIAQGKGRESVIFNRATLKYKKHETKHNPLTPETLSTRHDRLPSESLISINYSINNQITKTTGDCS